MTHILKVKQNGVWVDIPAVKGDTGAAGQDGADGVGVVAGGTIGQALVKKSNTDYDTEWATLPSEVTETTVSNWGFTKNVGTVTSVNNTSPDGSGNVALTIPAAQIQSDWTQADNTKLDFIKNKPSIPTKTSDLTNDSSFVSESATGAYWVHTVASPDFANGIQIDTQDTPLPYTCPDSGYIYMNAIGGYNSIALNSTSQHYVNSAGNSNYYQSQMVPVSRGDVVTDLSHGGDYTSLYFIPMKGTN